MAGLNLLDLAHGVQLDALAVMLCGPKRDAAEDDATYRARLRAAPLPVIAMPPAKKPTVWDIADAIEPFRHAMLRNLFSSVPAIPAERKKVRAAASAELLAKFTEMGLADFIDFANTER